MSAVNGPLVRLTLTEAHMGTSGPRFYSKLLHGRFGLLVYQGQARAT